MIHLSSGQISRWIAGQRTECEAQHVRECETCHADLAALESEFLAFGRCVREWAAEQQKPPLPLNLRGLERPYLSRPWVWRLGAAVIAVAIGIPFCVGRRSGDDEAVQKNNARLMEQVQAQLSRSVPTPMEPLMNLMLEERDSSQ